MIIHYLIKLLFIILFFSTSLNSKEISKVIFKVNEQIYTNIDIENRKKYLSLIEQNIVNEELILDDYISVILFNEFAKKRKIKINKSIINDYLIAINNKENSKLLTKEILTKNIIYDYQRKIILEKFIKDDIGNKKNNKDFNQSDLFEINIKYYVIDLIYKKKLESNIDIENINESNINEIKLLMNKNDIKYNYYKKQVKDLDKINKSIKNNIINNKKSFYFIENYIIFGIIDKQLKDNLNLKYTLYQIKNLANKKLQNNDINCKFIDKLNSDENINVVKYDKIESNKINEKVKKELNFINDKVAIKNNKNETIFILLCELDYDTKLLEERLFVDKIDSLAKKFENEFIAEKKKEYNFEKY